MDKIKIKWLYKPHEMWQGRTIMSDDNKNTEIDINLAKISTELFFENENEPFINAIIKNITELFLHEFSHWGTNCMIECEKWSVFIRKHFLREED